MTDPGKTPGRPNTDDSQDERVQQGDTDRTLNNRPADPNRAGAKVRIPPGVDAQDLWDPGNQTPDAPPVDNRS